MNVLILYRVDALSVSNKGVINKMMGQKNAFIKLGHTVDCMYSKGHDIFCNDLCIYSMPLNLGDSVFNFFWYSHQLNFVLKSSYDLILIRYSLSTPSLISFISKIKVTRPRSVIVIDMPTFPYDKEWLGWKGKLLLYMDRHYRKYLQKYVSFIVHSGSDLHLFDIPTIRISNGIDVSSVPERCLKNQSDKINLIAVGKWQFWHGLDRLLYGLATSQTTLRCHLYVVGDGPELRHLKILAHRLGIEENVIFCGALFGTALDQLFDTCDIAVGTLGLHRKGVTINSSLKHREYCARGIPFILSNEDSDFDYKLPFVHYVPADEQAIDLEEIRGFYDKIKGQKKLSEKMRTYAIDHLSWHNKMRHILDKCDKEWL